MDEPNSTEVIISETIAPVWRASAGNSSPRKNSSSTKGAINTPKALISHASRGVCSILSMGSSGGVGSRRAPNSTASASNTPPARKIGQRTGHRQESARKNPMRKWWANKLQSAPNTNR